MEVTTLFGGSGASKDKCFPLLPFLWRRAVLRASRSGWESAEPRGHAPHGRRSGPWPGSRGQGSRRVTPSPPRVVLGGWKSTWLGRDHGAKQPDASDGRRSLSIMGILSYGQRYFFFFSLRVSIISIATATARTAHRRRFGVLMSMFSKSIGRGEIIVGALPLTRN